MCATHGRLPSERRRRRGEGGVARTGAVGAARSSDDSGRCGPTTFVRPTVFGTQRLEIYGRLRSMWTDPLFDRPLRSTVLAHSEALCTTTFDLCSIVRHTETRCTDAFGRFMPEPPRGRYTTGLRPLHDRNYLEVVGRQRDALDGGRRGRAAERGRRVGRLRGQRDRACAADEGGGRVVTPRAAVTVVRYALRVCLTVRSGMANAPLARPS